MGGSGKNFWGPSIIDGVKCSKLTHFTLNAAKNFIYSFQNTSRVNWSLEGQKSLWEGHCPSLSSLKSIYGSGGNGDICRRSGWLLWLFAWHALNLSKICLTLLSIPGNQIFSWSNCFVFTRPWYPSWAIETVFSLRVLDITMRLPPMYHEE